MVKISISNFSIISIVTIRLWKILNAPRTPINPPFDFNCRRKLVLVTVFSTLSDERINVFLLVKDDIHNACRIWWPSICTLSFFKQHVYKQRQTEINQAHSKQHPEAELLLFENWSHSSFTLSSKNNRTCSKNSKATSVSVFIRLYC